MRILGISGDGSLFLHSSCHAAGLRSPPVDAKPSVFNKSFPTIGWPKTGIWLENKQRRKLRLRAQDNTGESHRPIAPVQFESPTGQLLSQIMQTHPHLLPAAIDQQLERLQSDRDAEKKETPPASQYLKLNRRMAEVRNKERQRALEEIIYCFIVQRFIENDISMIPALSSSPSSPTGLVDSWPTKEEKLLAVHSPDALEMIQSHLSLIIGERFVGALDSIVQISKLKVGKLYAASIMYGYFLKRVDQRFQLERSMKTLPTSMKGARQFDDSNPNPFWDMESMVQISPDGEFSDAGGNNDSSYRLRSYVMYLDAETLQKYATIRSKEAISLIEKQTQALFGRPDIRIAEDGTLDAPNDEVIGITFAGLTMLVLEAVAFGSFLWDAESDIETKYHFLNN